jgi:polar amino acid transport system substrate-binding protein
MRQALLGCLALLLCPLLQAGPLRFVGSDFPGITQSGSPHPYGLGIDVINAICQRQALPCTIELLPWLRAQAMLQNGQADVLIGTYRTRERARFMTFSRYPLYVDTLYWYRQARRPLQWNGDFASLAGLHLGVTHGWTLGQAYENAKPGLDIDSANTLEQSMTKLQRQRLDLVASNERNARYTLARLGAVDILPIQPAIGQQGGCMGYGLHVLRDERLTRFEQGLSQAAESGELTRLSQRYGLPYPGRNTKWQDYLLQLP